MTKLNWDKRNEQALLYRRGALDYRRELEIQDRAARWLAAVERNEARRRQRSRERRSLTQASTAA
jgi:hypothetical protein